MWRLSTAAVYGGSVVYTVESSTTTLIDLPQNYQSEPEITILSLPLASNAVLYHVDSGGGRGPAVAPNDILASVSFGRFAVYVETTAMFTDKDGFRYGARLGSVGNFSASPTVKLQANVAPSGEAVSATTTVNDDVAIALVGADINGDQYFARIASLPTNGALYQVKEWHG